MASPEILQKMKDFNVEHMHYTKVHVVDICYVWKVENIQFLNIRDGVITSPIFASKHSKGDKWRLHILRSESCFFFQPCLVSSDRSCIGYKFHYSVLSESGQTIQSDLDGTRYVMPPSDVEYLSPDSMSSSKYRRSFKTNFGTINIFCTIKMLLDIIDIPSEMISAISVDSLQQQLDLSKLLETGQHSDVTLVVDGKEFKVHKAILSLRSAVFAAMFEHKDMEENKSNRVDITDFNHDVIKEMLQFIYTGIYTNEMDKIALDLLAAADKYSLQALKTICGSVLERTLNVDSALKVLIIADRHGVDRLKPKAMKMIKDNISNVSKTEEWKTFYSDYPQFVIEMLEIK